MRSRSAHLIPWLAVLAVGTAGCLCPPCPTAGGPAPATAATAATSGGAPAAPAASGSRLAIWDGEGAGAGAQGWESCDKAPNCQVKVASDPSAGLNGSTGLKFHGEGPGWIGMGWNLFGWYPETAGVDISPYSHLSFQIRVEAKSAADFDPSSATVLLGCSKNKKDSATISIERYAKGFADGKWHKVEIPISAFTKGPGAQFDLASFWEFRISTWSATPRNFNIYVDDITAEKQ